MTIDLTSLLQAVVTVVTVLITYYAVPTLKHKLNAHKQAKLAEDTRIAVTAAEQIFKGEGQCAKKKAYVVALLKAKGYSNDTDDLDKSIDALIECSVYKLKNS